MRNVERFLDMLPRPLSIPLTAMMVANSNIIDLYKELLSLSL